MKKFYYTFTFLLLSSFFLNLNAQTVKLWEKRADSTSYFKNDNNTRGLAYNALTNHVLLASRTGGANVIIMNPVNGDSLGKLDMTGVASGTYVINIPRVAKDGRIYVCNLALANGAFKIYRWANETAIPEVIYNNTVSQRTGDVMAVTGSGANTLIYASGSSSPRVYIFSTANDTLFTMDSISVVAGIARGGIAPMTEGRNSDLIVKGAGSSVYRINSTGTIIDTVNGGVISTGWLNVAYLSASTGKQYISIVGKNDPAEGYMGKMFDITNSFKYPSLFVNLAGSLPYVANANAVGDVALVDSGKGYFYAFQVITNNTVAAFKTNLLTIAQAKEDLNSDNKPDRLGDVVTIKGTVVSPNYQTVNHSYYVQDATGGICEYLAGKTTPAWVLGNSVQVTGAISQYYGLTEIIAADSTGLVKIADSVAVPAPHIFTNIHDYISNPEPYEGMLVAFTNLSKKSGTWPITSPKSASIYLTDGTADSLALYIDSDTDVDGTVEPTWPKDVIGIASQHGASSTAVVGGLQILPRYYATDFLDANTLPVELTTFTASVVSKNVVLNWATATEKNNQGFEILRQSGSSDFTKVGFVAGFGTTTKNKSYSYVDNTVVPGNKYSYKLKQVDFDGTFAYSKIVEANVTLPNVFVLSQNYPNPFNPSTKISFTLPINSKVSLKIFDLLGREVMEVVNGQMEKGQYDYSVNMSRLSSGIYFYNLEVKGVDGSSFMSTKKMTLLK